MEQGGRFFWAEELEQWKEYDDKVPWDKVYDLMVDYPSQTDQMERGVRIGKYESLQYPT